MNLTTPNGKASSPNGQSEFNPKKPFLNSQDYDPAAIPPNLEIAQIHAKAHRVSVPNERAKLDDKFCPCCGFNSNNEQYSLCTNTNDFNNISASSTLYFSYLKTLIIVTGTIAISCSIYLCFYYLYGEYCDHENRNDPCDGSLFFKISILNRKDNFSGLSFGVLFILTVPLVLNVSNFFGHLYLRFQAQKIDIGTSTASDYTVIIQNLPNDFTDSELRQYFERDCNFGIPIRVARIVRCYFLEDYLKASETRAKILFEKTVAEQKGENEQNVIKLREKLEAAEVELEATKHYSLNEDFNGVAFLTFEDTFMMRQVHNFYNEPVITKICHVLARYKKEYKDFLGNRLVIKRAPEPTDIFWQNLGQPLRKKIFFMIKGILFAIVAWAFCYFIIVVVRTYSIIINSESGVNIYFERGLYYSSTSAISLINVVLNRIIRQAMFIMRSGNMTKFSIGVSVFLTIIQFFNTNIASVIAIYAFQTYNGSSFKEFNHDNVIQYAVFVQASNSVILPLFNLFNPNYFILLSKRFLLTSGLWKNVPQQQANLIFEGPQLDLPQRYANITLMFLSAMFFLSLTPICIFFALFGLLLSFAIDKYLLLRRHSIPADLGKEIGYTMNDFLQVGSILFLTGKIVFYFLIFQAFSWADTIILFLIVLIAVFRFWRIISRFFTPEFDSGDEFQESPSFSEVSQTLTLDYDRANPIIQREAIQNFLNNQGDFFSKDESNFGNASTVGSSSNEDNKGNGVSQVLNIDVESRKFQLITSGLSKDPGSIILIMEIREKMRKAMAQSNTFKEMVLGALSKKKMMELASKKEDLSHSTPSPSVSPSLNYFSVIAQKKLDESFEVEDDPV